MKKLFILLSLVFSAVSGFSFAASTISNISYSVNGEDVRIYRNDNSAGGYVDINLQDPNTKDRLHFGEVKMSDQKFVYTKQWEGDQNIRMIPGDGGNEIKFTIEVDKNSGKEVKKQDTKKDDSEITRTVIPVVPKTGPSGTLIWIILATLTIFGGYIYIRKRADI